ncbi:bZIP transcription factor ABI5 homolog [Triticum dicoccoides]|uniref:bZIP transcription factor ABI5 homolog n=1 Tax=Triticum dicoccoides TaxID=85692 RepID=UPI00189049F1|nr:bZIP transcription factor ABI5 homolog [Triticum dicoccoides]XP_044346300.1 bZIP transcription factor ABI5 homolog [Triticum aestivum]
MVKVNAKNDGALSRHCRSCIWLRMTRHSAFITVPEGRSAGLTFWSFFVFDATALTVLVSIETLEQFLVKVGVVRGSSTGGQAPVPVGLVHGQMNPAQQEHQLGRMMYPMALANIMFQVMGDDMGFVPNGYVVIFVVPPSPPRQGSVGIVSHGLSDGRSAMTKADMMNYMGDRAMMENGGARKHGAPDDQSCKRSIERCHRRMIKNRESATRSCARKQAYTVELEAELNHLKEENARLKAEEKKILLTKKQMLVEKMIEQSKENVNAKKGGTLSRCCGNCIWYMGLSELQTNGTKEN